MIYLLRRGCGQDWSPLPVSVHNKQQHCCWCFFAGAASAPSQQHQLRRVRDAQNERDGAGLRISVAAPSDRRSSAARTMSGRRGSRKSLSSPSRKFAKNRGTPSFTIKPSFFRIIFRKSLFYRSLPWRLTSDVSTWHRKKKLFCVKKSCVWVVTHRIKKLFLRVHTYIIKIIGAEASSWSLWKKSF